METALSVRLIAAGITVLIASSMSLAEPAKPGAPAPGKNASAPVVLASAEIGSGVESGEAVASDSAQPPKRKRTARVTTCRCADQTETPQE